MTEGMVIFYQPVNLIYQPPAKKGNYQIKSEVILPKTVPLVTTI